MDNLRDGAPSLVLSTSVCPIRNLLENQHDVNSDSGGEEDFVPSRKDLESSEDEDDEEEVADLDSDEEVVLKRRRRASSCQTPRSKRSSGASRTPRKTPNKVTEPKLPQNDEGRIKMPLVCCAELPVSTDTCNAEDSQHSQQVPASPTAV